MTVVYDIQQLKSIYFNHIDAVAWWFCDSLKNHYEDQSEAYDIS